MNRLVPAAEIDEAVWRVARQIAANAPLSIAAMKEEMRILASAHCLPPESFKRVQALRRRVYDSADYTEGLRAFRERRRPSFTGE